jgi:hypothetical protein
MLANISEYDENQNLHNMCNKQIKGLINKCIEFQFENKMHCSRHVDLYTLLNKMDEYISQYDHWSEIELKKLSSIIKKRQQELPRHIVSKFLAKPDKIDNLVGTSLMVYNAHTKKLEDWYKKSDASTSFMIINGFKSSFPTTIEMPKANSDSLGLNMSDNLETLKNIISDIYNEITAILEEYFPELNLTDNYISWTREKTYPLSRNCPH